MEYTERLEGFQIRDVSYWGKPPENTPIRFDIVKWYPEANPHIGKVVFFDDMGRAQVREEMITEHCYSVGHLEWNSKEPCFTFKSIGLRWLEERPSAAVVEMVLKFCAEKEKEILTAEDRL